MTAPPTYSEDGEWMWNGEEWIPAPPSSPPPPPPPPPPKKKVRLGKYARRRKKFLNYVAVFTILIVIIAGSRWLFSPDKHTLEYSVAAISYDEEEFRLYFSLFTGERARGGFGVGIGASWSGVDWSESCLDVTFCSSKVEFVFEYESAFTAEILVECTGCEANLPEVCIEIKLDGNAIAWDCGLYSDPDDGANWGYMRQSVLINSALLDSLS